MTLQSVMKQRAAAAYALNPAGIGWEAGGNRVGDCWRCGQGSSVVVGFTAAEEGSSVGNAGK
eukprot:1149665-Pelagomonas_calceolata.AAC.1